jgi:3-oxoacyl-[acyl-carrier protein] reductase
MTTQIITYPDLSGKSVLVTGATRGIGKAIALALAKQKCHVVFNYRGDTAKSVELSEEISSLGGTATALMFDITKGDQIKEALDEYQKSSAPITGLVNNAGMSKDQIVLRLKEQDIQETLDTNLKGAILVTAALARNFLKSPHVSVVNISSIVGLMGNPSQIAYAAAKAGMIGFGKSLAKELASRQVRCNTICPGFIETDMTAQLSDTVREHYLKTIPLGRMGNGDEVANLVCFLLSQASAYITGEVIKIDGGLYI